MTAGDARSVQRRWRVGGTAGLVVWMAFLAGTVVGLHAIGGGLAPPPLSDPGGLGDWLEGRQPAEAAFAVLRLVALALAWYLSGATVVATLARLSGTPALIRAADLLTIPAVRRIVNAAAGVSIAAATFSGAAGIAAAADKAPPAAGGEVMTLLPDEDGGQPASLPVMTRLADQHAGPGEPPPPTLRRLPDEPAPGAATPSDAVPPAVRWEVKPGQHFWAVAEEVLAAAWQRAPSDAEIDPYWRQVVEANRAILRDPANPDLLYPGQILTVPPPPAAPHRSPTQAVPESGAPAPDS